WASADGRRGGRGAGVRCGHGPRRAAADDQSRSSRPRVPAASRPASRPRAPRPPGGVQLLRFRRQQHLPGTQGGVTTEESGQTTKYTKTRNTRKKTKKREKEDKALPSFFDLRCCLFLCISCFRVFRRLPGFFSVCCRRTFRVAE